MADPTPPGPVKVRTEFSGAPDNDTIGLYATNKRRPGTAGLSPSRHLLVICGQLLWPSRIPAISRTEFPAVPNPSLP